MTTDKRKKTLAEQAEKPVNTPLAALAGVTCVILSGMIAMKATDPDQGRVVTLAEMQVQIRLRVERIKNDPHIPPRVKSFALGMLNEQRMMGVYRERHGNH
jgi:hypothetical protein